MTLLKRFRNAGISDEDIIASFQFRSGGYSKKSERSYSFGSSKCPESFWGEIHFNDKGKLFKIVTGDRLASEKLQLDFVNSAINDINGDHGYIIQHRILFSQKPLMGKFQWKDEFRIKPCLNTSQIGKGLAWNIDLPFLNNHKEYLGPPYPFIMEVRTKKSSNPYIEMKRCIEALDFYQWLLGLLIPHLLGASIARSGQPKWTVLQKGNIPENHLAYEGFIAHESEIETGDNFSVSDIPDVPRYSGVVDYYNHLWFRSSEIKLPVQMEHYLDLIENLPKEGKENFRRSLYWFNIGSRLNNQEQLSLIPFSISVECLLPNPSKKVCTTCKKPIGGGPTKLFNEFMKKHLSLPKKIEYLKKSLYPKRSNMVHGRYAVAADQGYFSINKSFEFLFIDDFFRRAILDWLVTGTCEKKNQK